MLDGNILLQIFLLRTEKNCTYLSNPLRCNFKSKRLTTTSDGDKGEHALKWGADGRLEKSWYNLHWEGNRLQQCQHLALGKRWRP